MPVTQKIIVTRDIGEQALSVLQRDHISLHIWPEPRPADRAWLLSRVQGATGVLVMVSDKVDDELLDAAGPSLKIVSTMSVGYEHISLSALSRRGIKLGYTPDVLTDAVADISVMLALMASRNVGPALQVVQDGEWKNNPWNPFSFCGPQLSVVAAPTPPSSASFNSTWPRSPLPRIAGFLGFGRIARATVCRLTAFGISHIIYSDSSSPGLFAMPKPSIPELTPMRPSRVSIATLAAHSDFLFVLAPQTPATYHIVSAEFIQLMKPSAVLVNVARGGLVDSNALAQALEEGKIFGAGLDVVEGEPDISKDHPLIREPRCVILPHIGSATLETREGMATLAARNLVAGLLGEPLEAAIDLEVHGNTNF